jgi:hypothetical protein
VYSSPPPVPQHSGQSKILIVAVVVVAFVVIAGVILAAMAFSNIVGDSNQNVKIVVHSGYVTHSNGYLTPEAGNKYVVYSVTVTNIQKTDMTFSLLDFELNTTAGLTYMPSYSAGTSMSVPDSIGPGANCSLVLAYEIPETTQGTQIVYNWILDHGKVDVPPIG